METAGEEEEEKGEGKRGSWTASLAVGGGDNGRGRATLHRGRLHRWHPRRPPPLYPPAPTMTRNDGRRGREGRGQGRGEMEEATGGEEGRTRGEKEKGW
ncbi:hypothetical protein BHE74_00033584, partial [Ensete ventricosum]